MGEDLYLDQMENMLRCLLTQMAFSSKSDFFLVVAHLDEPLEGFFIFYAGICMICVRETALPSPLIEEKTKRNEEKKRVAKPPLRFVSVLSTAKPT